MYDMDFCPISLVIRGSRNYAACMFPLRVIVTTLAVTIYIVYHHLVTIMVHLQREYLEDEFCRYYAYV